MIQRRSREDTVRPVMAKAMLIAVSISISLATGCSEPAPERIALHGTVQSDGKPIERATLILTPASQTGTPVATRIDTGRFAFTRLTGPYAGEYTVRVNPDEPAIESIIEVAEQDPRKAAREFGVQRSKSLPRNATTNMTKQIEVTPQQKSPLRIDL
ncbi:hypothetical protein [Novipirellula caenicola]|uniref:Carboxypeptidase regulatory-like domain-containing protein n=1 Tax=Novipirellula caenicola TaxID=1536901 RepID=A0ABP9VR81_9BACT